jgi:hypothetical protein
VLKPLTPLSAFQHHMQDLSPRAVRGVLVVLAARHGLPVLSDTSGILNSATTSSITVKASSMREKPRASSTPLTGMVSKQPMQTT